MSLFVHEKFLFVPHTVPAMQPRKTTSNSISYEITKSAWRNYDATSPLAQKNLELEVFVIALISGFC